MTTHARALWLPVLVLCLIAGSAGAEASLAQAPSDADRAAAEALFNQAQAMMQTGDYEPACEKLRASKELDPAVGTMLYLGDCYEKANRLASAWLAFEDARVAARGRNDGRAEIAAVRAAALKPRLSYLVVELTGALPEGLEVRANGRVIPSDMLGAPAPIDQGDLLVVATAPGHHKREVSLRILPGAKAPYRAIIAELTSTDAAKTAPLASASPAPPPDRPPPEEPEDDGSGQRTAAYIVGGVGAASLIVGGVFTLLARQNNEDSLDECSVDDPNRCSVRGKSLRDDALSQASIATIAGIVGGVGVATGVTLYVTAPSGSGQETGFGVGYRGTF